MLCFLNLSVIFLLLAVYSTTSQPGPFDEKTALPLPVVGGTPKNTTAQSNTSYPAKSTNTANNANTANSTNTTKSANPTNNTNNTNVDDADGENESPETTTLRIPQIAVPPRKCNAVGQCKAACGSRASAYECIYDKGNCACIRHSGPPRRCRNVNHSEEFCNPICGRKIAQICYTDFGNFCTCFLHH